MSHFIAAEARERFQQEWERREVDLDEQIVACEQSLSVAEEEIETLEQQLAEARHSAELHRSALERVATTRRAIPQERLSAERELVRSTLLAGLESLSSGMEHEVRRSAAEEQLQVLIADRDLARKLDAHRAFEASRDQIAPLPEYHKQVLLEAQARLSTELEPIFSAEAALAELGEQPLTTFWLVASERTGTASGWILPFEQATDQGVRSAAAPQGMPAVILKALAPASGGKAFDGAWERQVARMVTDEERDLETIAAELAEALASEASLARLRIQVRVLVCSTEAWEAGWSGPSAIESGWYTLEDLRAWSRRVDEGSTWSRQHRRMRTLLMRLLARGSVGSESTPWQELWVPLPEPHRSAMREGLACLLANGILLGAERGAVAINPICMDEIEQFITRNITPLCERVLVRA